jgi:integrase
VLRTSGAASQSLLAFPPSGPDSSEEGVPSWVSFHERAASLSLRGQSALRPDMSFMEAFEEWLRIETLLTSASNGTVRELAPRTIAIYRQYANAVAAALGDLPIGEIHDGDLREFARARAICEGPWAQPCGQNLIRKETDLLRRILRAAHLWTEDLKQAYRPVRKVVTEGHRALDDDELERLLRRMQTKKAWEWVLYDTLLALHSTADTAERRRAKIKDADIAERTFRVGPENSKNKYRNRLIPLESDEGLDALAWLKARAARMGAVEPDHYLYPKRIKRGVYDPTQPMTVWCLDQAFALIREGLEGLEDLTPYDLRHTAITRLAKAGTPIATILAFAGHIDKRMTDHYTTISLLAKREAHRIAWSDKRLMPPPAPQLVPKKPPAKVGAGGVQRSEIA